MINMDKNNYIGLRFNRLVVVSDMGVVDKRRRVVVKCDCGVEKKCMMQSLKDGSTQSCGCLNLELSKKRSTKHGLYKAHSLYTVWDSMIQRCCNSNNRQYRDYGGRGVAVCREWRESYKVFHDWAIDKWKTGLQLDKDSMFKRGEGKLYCPEFCSFITRSENQRKNRRNRVIEFNGESLCIVEWSERLNIPYDILRGRLRSGWTVEKTLTEPVKKRNAA